MTAEMQAISTAPVPISYKFADGFHVPKGLTAETAANELEVIRQTTGQLIPENIINAARSTLSPLHSVFEWDDTVAGAQYRKNQASQLVRAIVVVKEEYEQPFRMFTLVKDSDAPRTSYLPTTFVVQDVDLLADGLNRLKKELAGALRSVEELRNLAAKLAPKKTKALNQAAVLIQRAADKLK